MDAIKAKKLQWATDLHMNHSAATTWLPLSEQEDRSGLSDGLMITGDIDESVVQRTNQ